MERPLRVIEGRAYGAERIDVDGITIDAACVETRKIA